MELFDNLLLGFGAALSLQNLWFCFIGVFVGTLIDASGIPFPGRCVPPKIRTRFGPGLTTRVRPSGTLSTLESTTLNPVAPTGFHSSLSSSPPSCSK